MKLHIDFESRSACDIRRSGVYQYWDHPTTEATMLAYAVDYDDVRVWLCPTSTMAEADTQALADRSGLDWLEGGPAPIMLRLAIDDPSVTLAAHNHTFERLGLARMGLNPALDRWDCTAARAAAMCLPRSLENSAKALRLRHQKDDAGHRLMLQMCKPRKPRKGEAQDRLLWWEDDERVIRLAEYCRQDVITERGLDVALLPLSATERATWLMTERMNDRGILVDRALVDRVLTLIAEEETNINATISARTAGAVPKVSDHGALTRWLGEMGLADVDSVDKAAVAAMLDRADLDPFVRSVLEIRRDGGGSSSKKWIAILARTSPDGRLRGAFVYCGASATGRWSSKGVQLQNLPGRTSLKDLDGAIADIMAGANAAAVAEQHGPPLVVASVLLRPAFIARPGTLLARGDYSQIEARVNPWLAGAGWKLDAFRAYDAGTGPDLYKVAAAGIYGCSIEEVTKDLRQSGKISELALGFGGGAGALQNMAKAYGLDLPHHPRQPNGMPVQLPGGPAAGSDEWIKRQWRKANPEVVGLWKGLEVAAIECFSQSPGQVVQVRTRDYDGEVMRQVKGVTFRRNSKCMAMSLPSGRFLFYWWPSLKDAETPYGVRRQVYYYAENDRNQFAEFSAYGGLLCENLVQATARDIMRDALLRMEARGVLPVLTVHDEGGAEVESLDPETAARVVEQMMLEPPEWTAGLPIAADSSAGRRYVK